MLYIYSIKQNVMENNTNFDRNDVEIHKNNYRGYIVATRMAGEILEVQVMLCENGVGRKLSWFQKRWYTANEVTIQNTQNMWYKTMAESKK